MSRRDTRELILSTSLALFNQLGEPNVTTNLIADEADISPGNLYYHFHQKQDIVQVLFSRFAEALVPLVDITRETRLDAESLWFRLHMVFEIKGEYRFIYRNLSDISARIPDVEKALRALFMREKAGVREILRQLNDTGAMEADDSARAMLEDQLMLTLTYWIPFAVLFDPGGASDGSAQVRAIARVFVLTLPYLHQPWRDEAENLAKAYLSGLSGP